MILDLTTLLFLLVVVVIVVALAGDSIINFFDKGK